MSEPARASQSLVRPLAARRRARRHPVRPHHRGGLATCSTAGLDLGAALAVRPRARGAGAARAEPSPAAARCCRPCARPSTPSARPSSRSPCATAATPAATPSSTSTARWRPWVTTPIWARAWAIASSCSTAPPENIVRGGRVQGHHVRLPRRGVAVHINAFNFPAWGLAEKAATALLAGMPVLSKPATSTALVDAPDGRGPRREAGAPAGRAEPAHGASAICSITWVRRTSSPSPAAPTRARASGAISACSPPAYRSTSRRTASTRRSWPRGRKTRPTTPSSATCTPR
jgi:hypothetical protein